jgi:hypothetical protein
LQVFPVDEEHWEVTVDGEEVSVTCTSTYQAWAIGVAESYRRGKRTRPPPDAERS